MTYSPSELVIARGHARRGTMEAGIDGLLQIDRLEFRRKSVGSELI